MNNHNNWSYLLPIFCAPGTEQSIPRVFLFNLHNSWAGYISTPS